MTSRFLKSIVAEALLALCHFAGAQTLFLDPVGVGASVTLSGGGGPPSASVELFKNGVSVGSFTTSAGGQFSIPNISAAANDQFYVAVGQVWNFNADGNTEGWTGLAGDGSVVSGGIWKQTNSASTDMSFGIYGDGLILTRARALEVRLRYTGTGNRTASIILQSAGPNGVAGGGDDGSTTIANTATVSPSATFQTYVFDLGIGPTGLPTCWVDGTAPININFYLAGMAIGEVVEVDSIRLTEALRWEFDTVGDTAEWAGNANTTVIATNAGTIRLNANGVGSVTIARPFRNIGSTHFVTLQTRFRQVTATQPNLFNWNYFSNPSSYGTGGYQISTPANGSFQIITTNLTGAPTYGNPWGAGGGATLNFSQQAFQALYANAPGEFAEIDYIRLLPASPYGPSPTLVASGRPVAPAYYVSSSGGNDSASGRDATHPWATFTNLDGLTLGAGSTVYLKRGGTWANSRLHLTGKGAAGNPITLTAYGDGTSPLITGINLTNAPCIQWENPSYIHVESMDCRDAKIGIYLRYTGGSLDGTGAMFRNTNILITCCNFQNMDEQWSETNGNITVLPPYEISFGTGIWIGGAIPSPAGGPWASASTPILDDFSVTHCGFKDVSTGVSMNFYWPPAYKGRFTNFRLEDSWVTGCESGSFALFYVDGGSVRRVDTWVGGSGFYNTGTTAGFIQNCKSVIIADCEFAGNKRNSTANDGTGFDFEGDCNNLFFTNNVLHDNDGSALMVNNTVSNFTALNMGANTVWNNCRDPVSTGQNNEFRLGQPGSSGSFYNIGVYRGANNAFGAVAVYDSATRWNTSFSPSNIRSTTSWASVNNRPVSWNFTSTVEDWGAQNQWSGFAASGGDLVGTASGTDPYAESAATWVNTRERRWVHVRMSQTAGSLAQLFFQLETDQTFTGAKSVFFPIIADGGMRDYIVDMSQCAAYQDVVTKWRLDPTDTAGSVMAIDTFESVVNPYLASVTPVSTRILDLRFNQAMLADGGVFSPANYTLSGSAQGTAAGNPSSVSLIATTNGPAYRLTWNSGDMNGAAATLTAANAQNARGYPLWGSSVVTFINTFAQPAITSFSPASGRAGTNVVILGTNFTGATSVLFNGLAASFAVNNNNQVTATVPPGTTTGPISISIPAGGATTVSNFVLVPIISDLLVTVSNTPNPVTIGSNVTSIITVKNLGADAAPSVVLTNTLPVGANLVSAAATQGTLATNANVIIASIGTLASNATAIVAIVFVPSAIGGISVTAAAGSINPDPNAPNNSATVPGFVEPLPILSITFASPDQINILWSGLLTNWVLQANASLMTNVPWSNVPTAPVLVSGTNTVTETNAGTAKFYWLQR